MAGYGHRQDAADFIAGIFVGLYHRRNLLPRFTYFALVIFLLSYCGLNAGIGSDLYGPALRAVEIARHAGVSHDVLSDGQFGSCFNGTFLCVYSRSITNDRTYI